MGYVFAEIELSNPRQQDLTPLNLRALADTGALMLCIPEHIALQLSLETESFREVSAADGRKIRVPYVGVLRVLLSLGTRHAEDTAAPSKSLLGNDFAMLGH